MTKLSSPTVSVVMPTYNRADLLPQTIASILGQDFNDFELLIVDDGSTDNTAELIQQIQGHDPRLRYARLPQNRGIGFAREAGRRNVSARYLALADSDDLWLPGKLKTQLEILEAHPEIDILFADYWNIDHIKGTKDRGFVHTQAGLQHLTVRHVEDELWLVERGVETGILRSNFIHPPTMVLRAEVFDRIGGFDTALITKADHEFGWRAAVLGARYAYINRPLIERHRYASSATARVVDSSRQLLGALAISRQTCQALQRPELLSHIRAAEQRGWCNIIRTYSEEGRRAQLWRAYGESLHYGFSLPILLFFILGLAGPDAIESALSLRTRFMRSLFRREPYERRR
jgi:glycosyltransferase involved in cell wall biosynthesis